MHVTARAAAGGWQYMPFQPRWRQCCRLHGCGRLVPVFPAGTAARVCLHVPALRSPARGSVSPRVATCVWLTINWPQRSGTYRWLLPVFSLPLLQKPSKGQRRREQRQREEAEREARIAAELEALGDTGGSLSVALHIPWVLLIHQLCRWGGWLRSASCFVLLTLTTRAVRLAVGSSAPCACIGLPEGSVKPATRLFNFLCNFRPGDRGA